MQVGVREYLNELFKWMESAPESWNRMETAPESWNLHHIVVRDGVLGIELRKGDLALSHAVSLRMIEESARANLLPVVAHGVFKELQAHISRVVPLPK